MRNHCSDMSTPKAAADGLFDTFMRRHDFSRCAPPLFNDVSPKLMYAVPDDGMWTQIMTSNTVIGHSRS